MTAVSPLLLEGPDFCSTGGSERYSGGRNPPPFLFDTSLRREPLSHLSHLSHPVPEGGLAPSPRNGDAPSNVSLLTFYWPPSRDDPRTSRMVTEAVSRLPGDPR